MLRALIKTMRPKQWTKNVFVFIAVIFDRQLGHPTALLRTSIAFALFCLLSSAVYILNDVVDVEADRKHPKKCNRPIAHGDLPIPVALGAIVVILLFTIPACFYLSLTFGYIAIGYFTVNVLYSLRLKHISLIDVLILASGFVLRVAAGVSVIHVERFSPWLYVMMTLGALFIGLGKRRAELVLLEDNATSHRKVLEGYSIPFLDQLITIVSSTTIVAYSLYTFSAPNLPENHTMMLTIPFVLYGIFRYLYLIQIKGEGGSPEDLILTDRPLQVAIGLMGVTVFIIFYILH
jgi:4-hydroxybenzoate polyprenyltransferase